MTPSRPRAAAALALAALLLGVGGCQTRSLVAVRESGDQHYQFGEYDAALTDYKEYVERQPGNAHVHHMMGMTYLKLGNTGLGREQLYIASTLRMEDDDIFRGLCEGLYQDKKYDDLNRLLRQRTVDRGRMQDWALLAEYSQKLGDKDEAQRAWLTAAQVSGGRAVEPQLGLARLYLETGDKARARKRLAMAYWLDPSNQDTVALIRQMNEVPGPTFGMPPEEFGADEADRPAAGEVPASQPMGAPGGQPSPGSSGGTQAVPPSSGTAPAAPGRRPG
jgi:Tfp pilus assembly protein PilF